jgi:hypothetical protein
MMQAVRAGSLIHSQKMARRNRNGGPFFDEPLAFVISLAGMGNDFHRRVRRVHRD